MEDNMNNEEEFLLKWNNHQSNLIGVFKEWLRDESFVDVTLVCGGEAVSGHKVVLAACSPLLNRILHDNPCRHPVVILNNVCSGDMKALLKFIYQGEVSVSQSELASFLRTADNLQIKGLAEDKEKDDRKRKEKDSDVTGEIRKRRKTEFKVSSQHSQVYNKNLDSVSSSPKSRKNHSPHRDKISSLNSHQTPSGGVRSNSVNNQMVINTDSISHTLEAEYEQSSEQHYKNEELVVKTEPLDYTGEMVWQEGNSLIIKSDSNQDICSATLSNASSSHSLNQHSHSATLPFGVLPPSLENLGSASTTEFIQKSLESFQSGDDKRMEEDGKGGSDEYNQPSVVASYEEGVEEETLSLGSPGKFRGGRKPCCFCGKTFCDNYTLRRHMVTHLSRQRQFECSLCSAAYSRKDHLMAHMRRKHPAEDYEIEAATKPS